MSNTPISPLPVQDDDASTTSSSFTPLKLVGYAAGVAVAAGVFSCYRIAGPSEYLVKTGLGVSGSAITKSTFCWPLQRVVTMSVKPTCMQFRLQAKTTEFMPFLLPGAVTVQPVDEPQMLQLYAKRFLMMPEEEKNEFVTSIIEGTVRVQAASMTMDELFQDRMKFKSEVHDTVKAELQPYGLEIVNAVIREMEDGENTNFFRDRSQRALQAAHAHARVSTASAETDGSIGEKEKEAECRQRLAGFEAETARMENVRGAEMAQSKADLEIKEADLKRAVQVAKLDAEKAAEVHAAALQVKVEEQRQRQEEATLRAKDLTVALVDAEVLQRVAEGKKAARLIEVSAEAESKRILAEGDKVARAIEVEAEANATRQLAEADFVKAARVAQGEQAHLEAFAAGNQKLVEAFNGDAQAALTRTMISEGVLVGLADSNARAMQGLNPKLNVWTDSAAGATGACRDLAKCIPPSLAHLESMGVKLPSWMPTSSSSSLPPPELSQAALSSAMGALSPTTATPTSTSTGTGTGTSSAPHHQPVVVATPPNTPM